MGILGNRQYLDMLGKLDTFPHWGRLEGRRCTFPAAPACWAACWLTL